MIFTVALPSTVSWMPFSVGTEFLTISEKIEAPENASADGETNNEDKPSSDEAPSDGKPEPKQENDSRSE